MPAAPSASPAQPCAPLSPREQQVLDLLCEGHSNKEIARALGVSARTVEVHRMRAIARIGAKSSIHAVSLVFKQRFAALQTEVAEMRAHLDAALGSRS